MQIQPNYLSILVAAIVSMVIGAIWYSKPVFGKAWMKESGFTAKDEKAMKEKGARPWIIMFISTLVMSYVIAHFVSEMTARNSLVWITWVWLGFVATIQLGRVTWGKENMCLFFIDSFFWLVNFLVMAWILSVWV